MEGNKESCFEKQNRNMNTVQIRLAHLFLLSSDIASEDLMGLNLYIFGDLTDFLVAQDQRPLIDLNTLNGVVWVISGVCMITFSLFLSCFTISTKSSSLTSDTKGVKLFILLRGNTALASERP